MSRKLKFNFNMIQKGAGWYLYGGGACYTDYYSITTNENTLLNIRMDINRVLIF